MATSYNIDCKRTAASGTYVTNAQADNYLKVEFDVSAENTLIDSLLAAAEQWVEDYTDTCINEKNVTLLVTDLSADGAPEIMLPYRGTVTDIVVKSYDEGTETVLDGSAYYLMAGNILVLKSIDFVADSFLITYTVTASNIPSGLTVGILRTLWDFYNFRGDNVVGVNAGQVSMATKALLTQHQNPHQWI